MVCRCFFKEFESREKRGKEEEKERKRKEEEKTHHFDAGSFRLLVQFLVVAQRRDPGELARNVAVVRSGVLVFVFCVRVVKEFESKRERRDSFRFF